MAPYIVGRFYQWGNGVEQDFVEAVKWWQMAAAKGNEEAKQLAEECVRKEYKDC